MNKNQLKRLDYLYEKEHSIGGLTKEERMEINMLEEKLRLKEIE